MKGVRQKGGVLFTREPDIVPELQRFAHGTITVLGQRRESVILQLDADPSTVLGNPCAITSILLKIVAVDRPVTMKDSGHVVKAVTVSAFEDEVHIHQEIMEKSLREFDCSITSTLLYADLYSHAELMHHFPIIGNSIIADGPVGLIFMEKITKDGTIAPILDDYYEENKGDTTILPKARRLLIMLAQLGFYHNDFHMGNIIISTPLHGVDPAFLIIDFGRASRIAERNLAALNALVARFDQGENVKEEIISIVRNGKREHAGFQWFLNDEDRYNPEIDGRIEIATEEEVTTPIKVEEQQKAYCVSFLKIPYKNKEIIRKNGNALSDYPRLQNNKPIVMMAVKQNGMALEYADPALRGDKEVVMTAVLQTGMALRYASPEMRADRDVLRIALRDLRALPYAIRPEKEFIMNFIRRDGLSLAYLPGIRDKEVILEAVRQNGMALHYVDKEVQDVDMVMAAVSQNGLALKDASEAMKTMEVVVAAVSQNGMALEHASAFMKAMEEVVMAAVRQNGMALQYASATLRKDEQVVLTAVLQNGRAIQFTTLKRNPKIILYASVNGHRPTEDEIKQVLPFLDTYVPSEEDKELMTFTHVPKMAKKMSTVETFRTLYEREIINERRRLDAIPERTSESLERLSDCRKKGNCNVQGGTKNKRVMYGRKSRRVRSKSRRT